MNDTHNLPASMVEAASRALYGHGSAPWSALSRSDRAYWFRWARAVLAAALAECEVREEWSAGYPDVDPAMVWRGKSEAEARSLADLLANADGSVVVMRRLVITTPAENVTAVDTPAHEETAK